LVSSGITAQLALVAVPVVAPLEVLLEAATVALVALALLEDPAPQPTKGNEAAPAPASSQRSERRRPESVASRRSRSSARLLCWCSMVLSLC